YLNTNLVDYSVQARVRFPIGAFGGGIGGRVSSATGAHYAAWIYPETTPGGSATLSLLKFDTWTNWSGTPLQQVSLPAGVSTNWHTLKLAFTGSQISIYYDGGQVMSLTDGVAPYGSGGVSVDMWTPGVPYAMSIDDVVVNAAIPVANNDSYIMASGTTLNVP